jgi:hypothetical protein
LPLLRFAAFVAIVALACGSASLASARTVGSFRFTGQLAGAAHVPASGQGAYGNPIFGCQISAESGTTELLINLFRVKLRLTGHMTTLRWPEMTVQVVKKGTTQSLVPNALVRVGLSLDAGGWTYQWASVAGTVHTAANARSGSINVLLAPVGTAGSPERGKAASKVHISGSWTNCHRP